MQSNRPICKTCPHYGEVVAPSLIESTGRMSSGSGVCHIKPPTHHGWPRVYNDYRCGAHPDAHINRTHELLVLLAKRLNDEERAVLLNGQVSPFARPFR